MRASILVPLVGQATLGFALPSERTVNPRQSSATAYASNSDNSLQLSSVTAPVQGTGDANGASTWNLTIDDTSSGYKQTIVGFGAAVTDATVTSFNSLSSDTLSALLSDLMTSSGANFALMRHTIGASDLSADPVYTYDDNGGTADPSLTGFGLGDRGEAMATMLASMKSLQSSLHVLGSPWSPPGWMKQNGVIEGNTDGNNMNTGDYGSLADYLVKYIQAYAALGATVDSITIQNEPLNSQSGYPTMYMAATEQGDIVQNYVGPALASAGLSTDIWAYDHNTDQPTYPQTVLDAAGQYVSTVAWHCYATNVDWTTLSTFKQSNANVQQFMTECWTPSTGSWNQAADFTMGPLQNWAAGVAAWTLGTDSSDGPHLTEGGCATCTGLVTTSGDSYTFQTAYYMMAQFSKFIPPGAIILDGTGSYSYDTGGVQSVASVNPDGTRSVVIENTFSNDVYVYLTTESGEQWAGNVPTESVTTWVLPASS